MKALLFAVGVMLFGCGSQAAPKKTDSLSASGSTSSASSTSGTSQTSSLSNGGSTGSTGTVGSSGSTGTTSSSSSGSSGTQGPTYALVNVEQDCSTIVQQYISGPKSETYPDGGAYVCGVGDGGLNCPFHDPDYEADFALPGFDPASAMMMSIIMCDSACQDGTNGIDGTNTCALQQDFTCQADQSATQCQINGVVGVNGTLPTHSCRPATNYTLDTAKISVDCGQGQNHYQHVYVKYLVLQ